MLMIFPQEQQGALLRQLGNDLNPSKQLMARVVGKEHCHRDLEQLIIDRHHQAIPRFLQVRSFQIMTCLHKEDHGQHLEETVENGSHGTVLASFSTYILNDAVVGQLLWMIQGDRRTWVGTRESRHERRGIANVPFFKGMAKPLIMEPIINFQEFANNVIVAFRFIDKTIKRHWK
jgi:hypothetical protein